MQCEQTFTFGVGDISHPALRPIIVWPNAQPQIPNVTKGYIKSSWRLLQTIRVMNSPCVISQGKVIMSNGSFLAFPKHILHIMSLLLSAWIKVTANESHFCWRWSKPQLSFVQNAIPTASLFALQLPLRVPIWSIWTPLLFLAASLACNSHRYL